MHYGSESDLQLPAKRRRLTGILAYADYARDRFAADTHKLWLEINYSWNDE